MAVTVKGFQGTVSDADMATQLGAHHGPTVRSPGDLVVGQTNVGSRQLSIAAGISDHAFVKYTSDAAQYFDVAPPSSGGKWILVAVNRQWSPTNTAAAEVLDTGATTDGTIPIAPTLAAIQAAYSVLRRNPGTAGSTVAYGAHAPLALVHVRAADTTVTIFDLRLRRTGAGNLVAPTLWAAIAALLFGHIVLGALLTVDGYSIPGGGYHQRSAWVARYDGRLVPQGRMEGDDGGASYFRNHVQAVAAAFPASLAVTDRSELLSTAAALVWNWSGDDGQYVPRPQVLVLKRWAQWNFGPFPRADWGDPPLDTWWDPFGIANFNNGITLPATGRYRAFGKYGYAQTFTGERVIACITRVGQNEKWAGLPGGQMFGDTGYPFEIYFEGSKGQQVKFRVYHSGNTDLYASAGGSGNSEQPFSSEVLYEYLGR